MIRISLDSGGRDNSVQEASERIDIRLVWKPLPEAVSMVPPASGIYWLGAPFNVRYGATISRVFYIGSALNLRKRLSSHANIRERGNYLLQIFSGGDTSTISASFHPMPGLREDNLRGLEYEVIHQFGVEHGFIPHGNRIPPESDSADRWSGRVRVVEPRVDGDPLSPEQIAEHYGLLAEHDPYPIFSTLTIDLTAETANTGPKVYSVNFRLKPKVRTAKRHSS